MLVEATQEKEIKMTKKEKINTLKAIIQECEEYQWWRKKALFEIIEDLEQEKTEQCEERKQGKCPFYAS